MDPRSPGDGDNVPRPPPPDYIARPRGIRELPRRKLGWRSENRPSRRLISLHTARLGSTRDEGEPEPVTLYAGTNGRGMLRGFRITPSENFLDPNQYRAQTLRRRPPLGQRGGTRRPSRAHARRHARECDCGHLEDTPEPQDRAEHRHGSDEHQYRLRCGRKRRAQSARAGITGRPSSAGPRSDRPWIPPSQPP